MAISAAAASTQHSNNSYRWAQSNKAAPCPAGAGPRPCGLRLQNRNVWPRESHTMNRHLRKQPTKNRCSSRLSSLNSHISTGEKRSDPRWKQPMRNQRRDRSRHRRENLGSNWFPMVLPCFLRTSQRWLRPTQRIFQTPSKKSLFPNLSFAGFFLHPMRNIYKMAIR